MSHFFHLSDIENLIHDGAISYTLPLIVMDTLRHLEKEIDAFSTSNTATTPGSTTPVIPPRHHSGGGGVGGGGGGHSHSRHGFIPPSKKTHFVSPHSSHPSGSSASAGEWERSKPDEATRNFKATKLEVKEGIDKSINEIRVFLNKLSEKNYETQKNAIIEKIKYIQAETGEHPLEDFQRVTKVIFDIASSNKFFSELYAKLYKDLIREFAAFQDILVNHIDTFKQTVNHISYVDPDVNYDEYCVYNKANMNRRAFSLFVVNLVKNEVLALDGLLSVLNYFLDKSLEFIAERNKINEVEEIAENIHLILSNSLAMLSSHEDWKTTTHPTIVKISKMKLNEFPSLSNRVVFKYMDIIDIVTKSA